MSGTDALETWRRNRTMAELLLAEVDPAEVRRVVRDAMERALGPGGSSGPSKPGAEGSARRVPIGCDHGGFELKEARKRHLEDELGWTVPDCGTHTRAPVDYPDYAAAVAREVAAGRCARGIVVDAAGVGSSMAANQVRGIRCALCHDDLTTVNRREHDDANILALGARVVNRGLAQRLARRFLTTPFGAGRHERRVQKIMALEGSRGGA